MYNGAGLPAAAAAGSGGALAYTGFNALFIFLAGFALLAAGLALYRALPKKEE